jgi:DNA mismatch repair protein MLH1
MVSSPTPLAANQGTTFTVEDLFYNVPTKRAALRSSAKEHNKIADVVTNYARHNSGAGFALKKVGEAGVDVKITTTNTMVDDSRTVYGPTVANELIQFSLEDNLQFKLNGFVPNVNYNMNKIVFLLFINNSMVDSTAI